MDHEKMRQHVHQGIDRQCASLSADPQRVQRVLQAAQEKKDALPHPGRMEKRLMKKKLSVAMVLMIVLLLVSGVALAAAFMNRHIEAAMNLAQDKGEFANWTLEDKTALIKTMQGEGIPLPQDQLLILEDPAASEAEKEQAATAVLTEIYGSEAHISHFTMAAHDWGDPFLWTLEQKQWFWETLRAKGLYTGRIQYLLPGENDLSRDEAAAIAKQAVQAAYQLSDEKMEGYEADVTFFTIADTETEPRWLVYLGHSYGQSADYSVLLTRDGQVTEDASLYVFKPEALAAQEAPASAEAMQVETPYQKRMKAAEQLYVSADKGPYHFLENCPSAAGEHLWATDNVNGYPPCPYCVERSELWSAKDKILYGVMGGQLPGESALPEEKAAQIAREHLLAQGMDGVEALVPYLRYIPLEEGMGYQVFFSRLENGRIETVCLVILDAETGDVVKVVEEEQGRG